LISVSYTGEGLGMKSVEENPHNITQAEIVVGIPSYNEAECIAFPTEQADKGLSKYFKERSCVIINCDNNSPDDTRHVFMQTPTSNPKIYISTPPDVQGKGNNLRNLFAKAVELSASAVVVVDADLASVTPQWVRNLGEPLLEEFDYVAPLYVRHKYEGTIATNIAYPLTRALYGRRVRQPIGGDFGFSGKMARIFNEAADWTDDVGQFGIDIWMTTVAMRSHAPIIQSFMGKPKVQMPKGPAADLGPTFAQVVGTIFDLMCAYEEFWKGVKWSRPTAVLGFGLGEMEIPPTVEVNVQGLWEKFSMGVEARWDLYRSFMPPATFDKLQEVAGLPREAFEFPPVLWAKVLYDFACAYKKRAAPRENLIEGLVPLYHGRTLSFVVETEPMNTQQVEELIEDQCLQFEKCKPYLLERWAAH